MRLFWLAFIMLLAVLPQQFFVFYMNLNAALPWHPFSWNETHGANWNMIIKVPTHGQASFDRWIPIAGSIVMFLFFGMGHDAGAMYRSLLLHLGLGRYFPCLSSPKRHNTSIIGSQNSGLIASWSKKLGSFSIHVKSVFSREPSTVQG